MIKKQIFTGLIFLSIIILLTGFLYPVIITSIADLFFNRKAKGSLIEINGKVIGSELIGQNFEGQTYFWSRPSAGNYNPLPSGGSNLGELNPVLRKSIADRMQNFIDCNYLKASQSIPSEMITASASGLDPHISPEAVLLQVDRIVTERKMNGKQKEQLLKTIYELTEKRQFSIFGEPRINVFRLNLMLVSIK